MPAEPLSTASSADAEEPALEHARRHLERLGYELLDDHHRRGGAHLVVARSRPGAELLFCELRAGRLDQHPTEGGLRRRALRRAALAWLAAHPTIGARTLRFDRLTVYVGRDGEPVGVEHLPDAF